MRIKTSRGKEFRAEWAWSPAGDDGDLMMEIADTRAISEIAADFEGNETIMRESEEEGNAVYSGYKEIRIISRQKNGNVQITLMRR